MRNRRGGYSGYTLKTLQPGESVKFASGVHWIVYAPGLFCVAISVVCFHLAEATQPLLFFAGFVFALLALISWLRAWWKRRTTEIIVTDGRVIYKWGFIRRHTVEMNVDKVESVHVDQSVLGRMCDFGSILVRGTGSSNEWLKAIDGPISLRNAIKAH